MSGHLEDFHEIWRMLDECHECPEKYNAVPLLPIMNFRRYRALDNVAIREFYTCFTATIMGTKSVGLLNMLVKQVSLATIMERMPAVSWKQWPMDRPNWIKGTVELAVKKCLEQKWKMR
jgi:hypothetical protein